MTNKMIQKITTIEREQKRFIIELMVGKSLEEIEQNNEIVMNMANLKLKVQKEPTIINWHWCDKEQHRQHQEVCQKCKSKKCPLKETPKIDEFLKDIYIIPNKRKP